MQIFFFFLVITGEFFDDFSGNADQKGNSHLTVHCVLFLEIFSAHLFAPILETVRQMLGLEEEQVVEISGDNSKYEVSSLKP